MRNKEAIISQRDASKKLTKKNLYFQRLLFLRYLVAFFFFVNLYWLLAASMARQVILFIPAVMLLFSVGSISEFIRLYGLKEAIVRKQLFFTYWYFRFQAGVTSFLFLVTFFRMKEIIFPYFAVQSMMYIRIFLFIMSLFSLLGMNKLNKIFQNKDRHWRWIRRFEEIEGKGVCDDRIE